MAYAVIQIRGTINTKHEIKDTLKMLNLTRANHCVVIPENEYYRGMLQKAKDYITWGEVDAETLSALIGEKGRLVGDKPITDAHLAESSEFKSIDDFARAVVENKTQYKALEQVKPLFRLHPPFGGHGSTKRPFSLGVGKGSLGYRGEAINALLKKMMATKESS